MSTPGERDAAAMGHSQAVDFSQTEQETQQGRWVVERSPDVGWVVTDRPSPGTSYSLAFFVDAEFSAEALVEYLNAQDTLGRELTAALVRQAKATALRCLETDDAEELWPEYMDEADYALLARCKAQGWGDKET